MQHAFSYDGIRETLALRMRHYMHPPRDACITGIILGNPYSKLGKEEYVPALDYWHYRSDNITDFFCAGFFEKYAVPQPPHDAAPVPEIRNSEWMYSARYLVDVTEQIEAKSSWRPSGGLDIIVCTARQTPRNDLADLDFTAAICIRLEEAKARKVVDDLSQLLNIVFGFAKSVNESSDPAWDLSDRQGVRLGANALRKAFESFLPKWLKEFGRQAELFAVQDISPK